MATDERRVTFALAAAAGFGLTVLWQPWLGGVHVAFTGFSLAFSGVLATTAWWGNRVAGATAAFMFGIFGPWSFAYIFGLPFLALAIWLGIRTSRAMKRPGIG